VLTAHTNPRALEETVHLAHAAAERAGRSISIATVHGDLADDRATTQVSDSIAGAVARLDESGSRLVGLVHNASSYRPTPLGTIEAAEVLAQFRVNALAPLLITQRLVEPLRRGRGTVVVLSDIHVLGRPRRRFAAYSMSKAAATDLVETLALELAPDVRVVGVAPGVVAWPDDADPMEIAAYEAKIPLGRAGTIEEAAELIAWLVREATYCSGQTIRIDGGRWLR
jgi:pteridine reductase